MEKIKFSYEFEDVEFGHSKTVSLETNQEILYLPDICEMFTEFITSAGFSIDGVLKYFKE